MKHVKCYIPEYPRPQLVRNSWKNLNGKWKFAFGEEVSRADALEGKLNRTIRVPFSYETEKSGIHIQQKHETVWYATTIKKTDRKRTLLHFEGADYITRVYINGSYVGEHTGAYDRFSFDITEYLTDEENLLVVECIDESHPAQLLGKQRWRAESFDCFYVQTTGIWKTVWLEYVEEVYLTKCRIDTDLSDDSVTFELAVNEAAEDVEAEIQIYSGEHLLRKVSVSVNDVNVNIRTGLTSNPVPFMKGYWSVDDPFLYDVELTLRKQGKIVDTVGSYFGMYRYETQGNKLMMNGYPEYMRMCLDQGYWKESGLTPPDEEAIVRDILACKEMGFNGVRKHQKNEDERFYYYADILGLYVWCELPSNQWFSDETCQEISREWQQIVTQNVSHPSLSAWVLYNENWGANNIQYNKKQQNYANALYYLTKALDPVRPVVSDDGWLHTKTDIVTLHRYEQDADTLYEQYNSLKKQAEGDPANRQKLPFADGYGYEGQPIMMSEFGGMANEKNLENENWGYGDSVKTDEEFLERFARLIGAVHKMDLAGYCYTQLTDVEQEVNGLLTADRTAKVDKREIRKRIQKGE